MKLPLLSAFLSIALLAGCVVPEPVVVRQPAPVYVYQPGYVVHTLPYGYHRTYYGHSTYYVNRGVYYRPSSRGYVVVRRPY